MFFFLSFDFVVLATTLSSYIYIFQVYANTRSHPILKGREKRRKSLLIIFRTSKFYVNLLLVIVFILFWVLPDLVVECLEVYHKDQNIDLVYDIVSFFYVGGYMLHAIIYIFLQKKVRIILLSKVGDVVGIKKMKQYSENIRLNDSPFHNSRRLTELTDVTELVTEL